jgi:TolB-like protein/Tfp pilus assembly protein PilF/predicted Ser/Thr protein kinase
MIGTTIGHFRILAKLGEGGMGVVYRAEDQKLKREVALKFLPAHLTATEEERARFVQEAQSAATLNHPNVCTIYGIEEHEGQQFIEMEYVDGVTLREKTEGKQLKGDEAVDYAIQIGEALLEAHSKGIVHRDVKAENIMVNSKNQAKVMDFGLAKLRGSLRLTKTSSTIGTLAYMAPEQIQGEEVDARSDIFSFGVVLYEMLTGRMPFRGEHDAAMMYSILNEDPDSLTKHRSDVPADLERIIERALEKEPGDRYQHVDDMVSELRRLKKRSGRVSRVTSAVQPPSTAGQVEASPAEPVMPPTPAEPVKRLSRPLPLIAAVAGGIAVVAAAFFLFFQQEKAIDSMAVLPFVNESGDPELEFLSDGFTETLINRLSKLPGMKMMSRSSVFRFKGGDVNPAEAGQSLGVDAVLAGRIMQRADRITVGVELVDARDQAHIWGEQYTRGLSDVLSLQDEITREISRQLKVTLSGEEEDRLSHAPTTNDEAYQLYLKGRFHWNKRTPEGFQKAAEYFRSAIESDPGYALAYAGLADAYNLMGVYYVLPAKVSSSKAKASVLKALELDDQLAEPHATLAAIYTEDEFEWEKGEEQFKRAIELNPSYATGHQWYGEFLAAMGRTDEAFRELRMAQELDPLSPIIPTSLGLGIAAYGDYDEGLRQIGKALELDPTFSRAISNRALIYLLQGKQDEAVAEGRRAVEVSGGGIEYRAYLAYHLARTGGKEEAEEILREIDELSRERHVSPILFAAIYTGLEMSDEAFTWLNRAVDERSSGVIYLRMDPTFRSLRPDPRFEKLMARIGL